MKVANKFKYLRIKLVSKGGSALIFNSDSKGYLPRRIFRFIRKWERDATNVLIRNQLFLPIWRPIWKHTPRRRGTNAFNVIISCSWLQFSCSETWFCSALTVLKRCCRPFLVYIYDIQFDFMRKITRNPKTIKIADLTVRRRFVRMDVLSGRRFVRTALDVLSGPP